MSKIIPKFSDINLPIYLIIYILQQYNFPVEENAVFGTQVGTVYASDKDSGSFGQLRYRLEGPNSDHFFVITNTENQEVSLIVLIRMNLPCLSFG